MDVSAVPSSPQNTMRRSANYHPSVWGDHFLTYTSNLAKMDAGAEEQFEQLKEEVKKMVVNATDNPAQQLNLIDAIQRLGVSYHFESEIEAALNHQLLHGDKNDDDLYMEALRFRLLRQQGHTISCDVFSKFKNEKGKFKESLISDTRGMISLYEATHLRVHDEHILDEALAFTTTHLEYMLNHLGNPLKEQVVHALNQPIRKGLTRVEARRYIPIYQEDDNSHNKSLLDFAKLDFNLLQKMHQSELSGISRWWKDLNFAEKLPFARDRIVEGYFWVLGVYFEPQYITARRILTKVMALTSIIDDIYDVYGTIEELILFTDAIERWDSSALDQLPEYMRHCYGALLDVYTEMEEELSTEEKSYRVHYAKAAMKKLVRAYLDEAKWFHEGYVPTIEEYMQVALVTCGYIILSTTSFVGMGELATIEAFDWVASDPLIVRASSVISRLMDDMVGHEFEQERGHVASAVECYMKQYGVSKQEVFKEFDKKITNAWKDINMECLRPTAVPLPLLERIMNLARVINLLYKDEDGYTHSKTKTKIFVTSLLIDPVPT